MNKVTSLIQKYYGLNILINSLLTLVSCLVGLVLSECLLFFLWKPVPALVETNELRGLIMPDYPNFYSFQPKLQTHVTSRTCEFTNIYQINSLGMRDREHPSKKSDGVKRVLFIGDSLTEGVGVEQHESYPYLIQELSQGKIESFNAGIRSMCPSFAYFQLQRMMELDLEIDYVVFQFFSNDLKEDEIYTNKFNLRIKENKIIREPFYQSAGGKVTRLMGVFAYPIYHTKLFHLLYSFFSSAERTAIYQVVFPYLKAEVVLSIFQSSNVNGIEAVRKNGETVITFPFLSKQALSEDGLKHLWVLEDLDAYRELTIQNFDVVMNPPKRNSFSANVERSLKYLDCIYAFCKQNNLPMLIYFPPTKTTGPNQAASYFSRWAIDNQVPFHFPVEHMLEYAKQNDDALYYPFDMHMTKYAHKIVAKTLLQELMIQLE